MAKVLIEETTLTAIGDAIRGKEGTTDLVPVNDMATRISAIQGGEGVNIPEEAYKLTGSCFRRFNYGTWNWFIDLFEDKMTTNNITDASYMFAENKTITNIPMALNFADNCNAESIFAGCSKLQAIPKLNNLKASADMFYYCNNITSLGGNKIEYIPSNISSLNGDGTFSGCNRLRSIGNFYEGMPAILKGESIFGWYQTFMNCYVLDELTNLPYLFGTYNPTYSLGSMVSSCYRLKELTFRGGIIPTGQTVKGASLDLSAVGFYNSTGTLTTYGIPDGKKVTDDASYQELKNDSDWWTADVAYSRYNHDSAVNTINSLPDVTNYTTSHTVKFKGAAGSATDGGAIENLTAEEIAVATAKGWTVTLA